MNLRRLLFVSVSAWAVLGAVLVTEQPGLHELRDAQSHPIAKYGSHAECVAAAEAKGIGRYRCVSTTIVDVTGSCEGVAPPAPATVTVIDPKPAVYADPANNVDEPGRRTLADGSVEYTFTDVGDYEGHQCPDGTSYYFTQVQPVHDDYPACWKPAPVEVTGCTPLVHDVLP